MIGYNSGTDPFYHAASVQFTSDKLLNTSTDTGLDIRSWGPAGSPGSNFELVITDYAVDTSDPMAATVGGNILGDGVYNLGTNLNITAEFTGENGYVSVTMKAQIRSASSPFIALGVFNIQVISSNGIALSSMVTPTPTATPSE